MRGAQTPFGQSVVNGPMDAGLAPVKRKSGGAWAWKVRGGMHPPATIYVMKWTRAARWGKTVRSARDSGIRGEAV